MAASGNPGENSICIGYLETIEKWRLSSKYFPSKVGGYPAWLALDKLPSAAQTSCVTCSRPLAFLCQLYLPDSEHDYAFHRALFIFVCLEEECCPMHFSNGLRVFRCNLPRTNKFYPAQPPIEEQSTSQSPSAKDYNKLCHVCGVLGEKTCGQCHSVNYCSRDHQALHWKQGHKSECKTLQQTPGASSTVCSSFLFPEAEIVLEPIDESDDSESDSELTEEQIKEEIQTIKQVHEKLVVEEISSGDEQQSKNMRDAMSPADYSELEQVARGETDAVFTAFAEEMRRDPEQVVRYHRRGRPLYCADRHQPPHAAVKPCPHCHQPRTFEFQLLPHMLNHLKVDRLDGASLDWGVVLVYSCFCHAPTAYTEELVFKQDIPPDQ